MKRNSAFSLLELSIVLVIIGLIAGGIVAGASMIRAAELRAIITEHSQFNTAVNTFRDKYLGLPGDLKNAEAFWGSMTNCDAASTSGTGTQTCNGDGNGQINLGSAAAQNAEMFTFWQHLANAELIAGSYSGIVGAGSFGYVATGDNSPSSKLSGGYWMMFNYNRSWSGASIYDGDYFFNQMQVGGLQTGTSAESPLLTPTELWNLDKKIDDGRPAYGSIRERFWDDCTDATASSDLDSDYLLSVETPVCVPMFILK